MDREIGRILQGELDKATMTNPKQLNIGQWHAMLVTIHGNKLTVSIVGEDTDSLSSEAIGLATKENFRVGVQSLW